MIFVFLTFSTGIAEGILNPSREIKEFQHITNTNFEKHGYSIEIQYPQPENPELKRFYIKFPKSVGESFQYSHSKAIYAKNGKMLLYYRPEAILNRSRTTNEYYILAHITIVPCLSLSNVYHKTDVDYDYGFHPPSLAVNIDLSSFLQNVETCNEKNDVNNVW